MPTGSPIAPAGSLPTSTTETWELRVPGKIVLSVLKANRFGQPTEERLVLGPNRKGMRFEISQDDRRDNQRLVAAKEHDPFTNGMLLRVDVDQQVAEETYSPQALDDAALIEILDMKEGAFQARVAQLGEVAVRGIREMAEAAGASHSKVIWLDEHIRSRFQPGKSQRSISDEAFSERLS